MASHPDVHKKIDALPEHVREQLTHYVDFLFEIYGSETDEANEAGSNESDELELTESGKVFLEERVKKALANPEKWEHWREVAARIHQKHGWPTP